MAHRGSFRGGRGISESQRRKKVWNTFSAFAQDDVVVASFPSPTLNFDAPIAGAASPAGQVVSYVFSAQQAVPAESTIMRIRGSLNLQKTTISATEIITFAFAIGVMETGAALTFGAIPNPASTNGANWDGWMFYRSQLGDNIDAASTIIDVKSMRKIQSGYSLVLAMGSEAVTFGDQATSAPAIVGQFTARGLFLLS